MVGAILVLHHVFLAFVVHLEKVVLIFEERRCVCCRLVELPCIAVSCILIEIDDVRGGPVVAAVFSHIAGPTLLAFKVALVSLGTIILRWRFCSYLLQLRVDL